MDEAKVKKADVPELTKAVDEIDTELIKLEDNVHGVIKHAVVLMGYNEEAAIKDVPDTSKCFMDSLYNKKEMLAVLNSRLHEVIEALKSVV